MTQEEQIGNLLIAIVKQEHGPLFIDKQYMEIEPYEGVRLEYTEAGAVLHYVNMEVIDGEVVGEFEDEH
jgi:hypothetical protein